MYEIIFYDTNEGKCPVEAFLESLSPILQAKALRTIDLLEQNGPLLREPYSKMIGDGLLELRVKQGNDIVRLLYFFIIGKKIIITNGFTKKTNKTPVSEIELAKRYKQDYEWRNSYGQL